MPTLGALATAADLTARNITVPAEMDATTLLTSASAAVRDAAGCPISVATSTITLPAPAGQWLDLPAGPVSAVATVVLNGVELVTGADYVRIGDQLWRRGGWGCSWQPTEVVVTYTHGLVGVPADIIDLVCALVGMAVAQSGEYGQRPYRKSVRLGDFAESYAHPAGEQPSPVAIPDTTRQRLRERFGTAVAVVGR